MPGFMGLRGLEIKNPHDMARERRAEHRGDVQHELQGQERRAKEKVQEILMDQTDPAPESTDTRVTRLQSDCERIANQMVTSIMSGRVAVLAFDDTLLTVEGIFSNVRFRHLPVVDEVGNIIGIISDRDFLRMVSPFYGTVNEQTRDVEIMTRKVGMVMTRNPVCIDTGVTILEAVKLMTSRKISCLPVVSPGTATLQGILTWKDIVRAFCPAGFTASDSNRLKTGVHINPESRESARLRAKSAESVRLRAASHSQRIDRDADRLQRTRSDPGQTAPSSASQRRQGPPGPAPAHVRRQESDTDRISLSPDQRNKPGEPVQPGDPRTQGARLEPPPSDDSGS